MNHISPRGRNTTHKQQRVTVHYFLHPLYTQEVQVEKELNYTSGKVYCIKFFDNLETYLPAWMTDPEYCGSCRLQDAPESSLRALRELRRLLDHLAL